VRRHAKAIVAISALLLLTLAFGVSSAAAAPTATIDAPSGVSYTAVHVSGTIDPEGEGVAFGYYFEYKQPGDESWNEVFAGEISETEAQGTDPIPVQADLTGLQPDTEYLVRLDAYLGGTSYFSLEPNPSFTTKAVAAPTVSIAAPGSVTGTSVHFSGQINPNAPEPESSTSAAEKEAFKVDWHFECTPTCPGLSGGTVAADNTGHGVSADATGLTPGTDYEVTLVASNAAGPVSAGPESFLAPFVVPTIESTDANPLLTEAKLRSVIKLWGLAASFHFEYGPTAAYGQSTPTEAIPAGSTPVTARATVTGLSEASTYHYRVIVTNSVGTVQGPDQTFTTQSPPAPENCPNAAIRAQQGVTYLGECRAYEMVSPLDKNGAGVMASHNEFSESYGGAQLNANGNGLMFTVPSGALPGSKSAPGFARYQAFRSGGDWSTTPVDPPIDSYYSFLRPWLTFGFSEDGTKAVVYSNKALAPGGVDGSSNVYLYDVVKDSYELIVSNPQLGNWSESGYLPFDTATPDLSSLIFFSGIALIPVDPEGGTYLWREGEGLQKLFTEVNGTPIPGGASLSAISPNGERALFAAAAGGPGAGTGMYLREDGNLPVQVSASQRAGDDPTQQQPFWYDGASRDLSKIFFTSPAPLTDESQAGVRSLYRYDVDTGELTDLLAGVTSNDPDVRTNYAYVSADGSTIAFDAYGALTPGASPGIPHIYLWRDGVVHLIASQSKEGNGGLDNFHFQISSDGRYFAMTVKDRLTSYNNELPACIPGDGSGFSPYCREVYVYDADAKTLRCASCQPDGQPPKGTAVVRPAQMPGLFGERNSRFLTDDGKVVFETADALVPRDVNEKRDVYTWRDGHVELISSGTGHDDSLMIEMNKDGSTVAFITGQSLVGRDTDRVRDAYISRVGGGLASQSTAPPRPGSPCGSSDQCRGPATTPAAPSKGGSESFESPDTPGGRSTVSIVSRKGSTDGSLRVAVSGPGKIVVSGNGAKRTTKKVAKKGTYALKVKPQGKALKTLHQKGKVTVKVRVQFLPQSGSASITTTQLTFKQGNSKGGK